jgi:hypothetical protein
MLPSQSQSLYVADTFIRSRCLSILRPGVSASLRCYKSGHDTCSFYHVTSREVGLHSDASSCNISSGETGKLTSLQQDQRSRLSKLWAPSGGIATSVDEGVLESSSKEMTQLAESLV